MPPTLDLGGHEPQKKGRSEEHAPLMTSTRLLKLFAILSLVSTLIALWLWRERGVAPSPWLIRFSAAAFVAALIMSIVDAETRPRLMLRFLSALFALGALISLAADVSRVAIAGEKFAAISLLQHLNTLSPSFVTSLGRFISHSISPLAWDPLLLSVLNLPATFLFVGLAVVAGIAGRPRQRVQIFVNDY
jgi:hypothetical protein